MKTVVYADILIFINVIVNYFLLKACSLITGNKSKTSRIIISSFIGALFSLFIYFDSISYIVSFLIKTMFMITMILTAFRIRSFKYFLKIFISFLLVNVIFGGIMLLINIFLIPESALYNNGIVYFDVDIFSLTITSAICYAIMNLIKLFIQNKTPEKNIFTLRITYQNKTAKCRALYDSGNTLCDCFSGRPVIIAEKSFIKQIIDTDKIEQAEKFRIIPFSTLSGNGTMQSFMAEKAEIYIADKWIESENIFIAITDKKIISSNFSALIGKPFFDMTVKK